MGIRGLNRYLDQMEKRGAAFFFEEIELKDSKVIIDGHRLYYYLYTNSKPELDWWRGGQYMQFHDRVHSFFKSLKSNNVEAFVLLDGASDPYDRKLKTTIKRAEDRSSNKVGDKIIFPRLLKQAFIQALGDLQVKLAVCDFEANVAIAALANEWGCPVMSENSDFFIFDLKAGYIRLAHIDKLNNPCRSRLFKVEKLAAHLGILKEFLPLLASILGNAFVSEDIRMRLYKDLAISPANVPNIISSITSLLKCASRLQDALQILMNRVLDENLREELRQALEMSLASYKVPRAELTTYFDNGEVKSELKSRSGEQLPLWVLEKFRRALFPTPRQQWIAKQQVEDPEAVSANQCSLGLRQAWYGIQGEESMKEWRRDGKKTRRYDVNPTPHNLKGTGTKLSLKTIPRLNPDERREIFFSILESNTDPIRALPQEDQLFVASVRYWIKHAEPAVHQSHLLALLLCYLMLAKDEHTQTAANGLQEEDFDLAAQHNFAQWQCVMHEALNVNFILLEPLPTPRIRSLYDGQLAQRLVRDFESAVHTNEEEVQILHDAAADGVQGRLIFSGLEGQDRRAMELFKQLESRVEVPTANKFEALAEEEAE